MPQFDQTDLQQTFQRATDVFNSGNYEQLRPLFHSNITWKMLHHAGSFTGLDDVIDWLKGTKGHLLPQFIPDAAKMITTSANTGDGSRRIRGPALWQAQRSGVSESIEYIFTFTTDRNGRWLLINAFAHVTD
jgi:hypothetical protein